MAEQVMWTGPDGTSIDLTDASSGYMVLGDGTRGLRSVEYEISSRKYAGIDGETVVALRAGANSPTLGLLVWADDEDAFRARARGLRHAMRPKAGLGTLCVRAGDGEERYLDCYAIAGLEGDESSAVDGCWWKLALKLYAPDPWWRGDEQTVSYGLGSPSTFFPIFPISLAASTVLGSFTVDLSDADAPSYPVWTVTGPGSTLILTNVTTGKVIQVNTTLSAGQVLTINTTPGQQSVRRNDGTNLMGSLATDPALWPLVEGVNNVTASLTSATTASSIACTYAPRYAGI
jgi:hypothetical protein